MSSARLPLAYHAKYQTLRNPSSSPPLPRRFDLLQLFPLLLLLVQWVFHRCLDKKVNLPAMLQKLHYPYVYSRSAMIINIGLLFACVLSLSHTHGAPFDRSYVSFSMSVSERIPLAQFDPFIGVVRVALRFSTSASSLLAVGPLVLPLVCMRFIPPACCGLLLSTRGGDWGRGRQSHPRGASDDPRVSLLRNKKQRLWNGATSVSWDWVESIQIGVRKRNKGNLPCGC
eukprot:2039979-Pleurochrysis_carterae.AAC.2